MDGYQREHHRFTRRALIGGITGGALASGLRPLSAQQPNFVRYSAAELLEIIRTTDDLQYAAQALIDIFARSGIAVYDESVTAMLSPLWNTPSPLSFVESQVATMVDELRQASYRAVGGFDAFAPEFSESGEPVPPFSDMYVRYALNVSTPGAEFVRAVLMTTPEGDGEMPASLLPAPTAAVSVLSGEILADLQAQIDTLVVTQVPTVPSLPNLPNLPGDDPQFQLPPLPELDNQVCSNVQMFVTSVIQRVLAVLEQTRTIVTVPIIDQIFGAVIGIVKFGLRVIIRAIDIVIAPVMGVLKSIAAAVAIASNILGTVSMWSMAIAATPDKTRLGQGPVETITGEIDVNAGGNDDIPWPAIVTNCAAALQLPLPSRTSAGSPVALDIRNPVDKELVYVGQEERILDSAGRLTVTYATRNESIAEVEKGKEEIGVVYISASVEREDLREFTEHLIDLLLADLPTVIANILRELTEPIVRDLRTNLLRLVQASASTRMYVTYHRLHCLRGHFFVANTHSIQKVSIWNGVNAENGAGTFQWWFNADGSCTFSIDGTVIYWVDGRVSYYSGVAEGTFSVNSGSVQVVFASSSARQTTSSALSTASQTYDFSAREMTASYGSWELACGETIYLRNKEWGDIWWLAPVQ